MGGACDLGFHAETFEEIADLSKKHGMEMYQEKESSHLVEMQKMGELMGSPEAMKNGSIRKKLSLKCYLKRMRN